MPKYTKITLQPVQPYIREREVAKKKGECIDHAGKDQINPWRDFAKDCLTIIKGCAVFAFLRAHNLTHSQHHQAASTLDQFWGHYVTGKK
jgi:hypothetical protein